MWKNYSKGRCFIRGLPDSYAIAVGTFTKTQRRGVTASGARQMPKYFTITDPTHIFRFGIDEISHGCGVWKPINEETNGKSRSSLFCQVRCLIEHGPKGYKSIAVWPDTISVGNVVGKNESGDTHSTWEQADAVCGLLRKQGFGGMKKVFPLSTRVEPVW